MLARLKADQETREIPVVVVSADAIQGRKDRFLAAGAAAYATKPIDIPGFLEILDDILTS